jgi:Protein of unknown function (DUF1153)
MLVMDGDFDANPRLVAATMPELPSPGQRWTVRRKASVIEALRGGWGPVEEVCRLYDLSADEIVAWERDIDRYGVHGLRSTRLQIYRDADKARREGSSLTALRTRYVREGRLRLSNTGKGGHGRALAFQLFRSLPTQ